jgi:hypothetical protein
MMSACTTDQEFRCDYHVGSDRKVLVEMLNKALACGKISPRQRPLIQRRIGTNGLEFAITVTVVEPDYLVLAGEPTLH